MNMEKEELLKLWFSDQKNQTETFDAFCDRHKAITVQTLPIVYAIKLWSPSHFHQWAIVIERRIRDLRYWEPATRDFQYITAFWDGKTDAWDSGNYGFDFKTEAIKDAKKRAGWGVDEVPLFRPRRLGPFELQSQNEVYNFFNKGE